MPELNAAEITAFTQAIQSLCDSLGWTMSEQLNQKVVLDAPVVTPQTIDDLIKRTDQVLQTTFSFPALCADEVVLAFQAKDAPLLAHLIGRGSGQTPPDVLEDEHMNLLAEAMSGIVSGLATGINNVRNLALTPGSCSTALETITLPPSFAISDQAVQVEIGFHVEGVLDSAFTLFLTSDFAHKLLPESGVQTAPDESGAQEAEPPTGFEEVVAGFGEATSGPGRGMDSTGIPFSTSMPAAFQPLESTSTTTEALPRGIDLILDIPLEVTVELGRVRMLIKDVLALASGSIVELERVAGEPLDLLVNGRLVAKGEVVVIDDNFGIRITEIVNQADRVAALAKR